MSLTFLNRRNNTILSLAATAIILTIVTVPLQYHSKAFATNSNINNAIAVQRARSTTDSAIGRDQSLKYSIGQHYHIIPAALVQVLQNRAESMGTLKHFTLIATSDNGHMNLPTGDPINLMTFNGSFPAPTLRVTQGDVVQVTVINKDTEIHSIDFHGSQLSAVPNFTAIPPGQNKTLTFVAVNPGAWVYHCEANNVFELWEHPLKGMTGMLIVDPKEGYKPLTTNIVHQVGNPGNYSYETKTLSGPAREFNLLYGEYYLENGLSPHSDTVATPEHEFSEEKMFNKIPTYTHVNGVPYAYMGPLFTLPPWNTSLLSDVITNSNLLSGNPDPQISALTTPDTQGHTAATQLNVQQGDHVRFYVNNAGDNEVAFHIVGEQLDKVMVGSSTVAEKVQTWGIPAYGDATIDVVFEQPGAFAIVNHDYSELFKGQGSIVVVWPNGQTPLPSPSNSVPPQSHTPNTSIPQQTCLYGIGPNNNYENNTKDDNQFISQCKIGLPS